MIFRFLFDYCWWVLEDCPAFQRHTWPFVSGHNNGFTVVVSTMIVHSRFQLLRESLAIAQGEIYFWKKKPKLHHSILLSPRI
jgi:hypothetical protein